MNNEVREEFTRAQSAAARSRCDSDAGRLAFHLMPPTGWMNDPNGLCRFKGRTHIFFQYSPERADGHSHRGWGHYSTKDYIHYQEENDPFVPDTEGDANGSYSGSALIENGVMHLFYTGNRKLPGDHDYIRSGRTAWTLHSTSKDAKHFTEKEVLLTNEDYPDTLSCHVRDPKILPLQEGWIMVLGARDLKDQGQVLMMKSTDLKDWSFFGFIKSSRPFGYMWECPDLFDLDGHRILLCCPQGVEQQGTEYENIYQSGWFEVGKPLGGQTVVDPFHTLDHGFDFYAPQTFEDDQGRRILIGWMGIPDADYSNPDTDCGWQHALTLPRQLLWRDGQIVQKPLEELQALRQKKTEISLPAGQTMTFAQPLLELHLQPETAPWTIRFRQDVRLDYDGKILTLSLGQSGCGRDSRHVKIDRIQSLDLFSDTSSLEVFVNGGQAVLTTRLRDAQTKGAPVRLSADCGLKGSAWRLGRFDVRYLEEKCDPTLYRTKGDCHGQNKTTGSGLPGRDSD